jgi:hypothetical protein
MSNRRNPNRKFSSHPLTDACAICERDLGGTAPLLKRGDTWVHRECWARTRE